MKRLIALFCGLLLSWGAANAQLYDGGLGYREEGGIFYGGVGYSSIEGEDYISVNFRPELSFGKIGVGLNINLLYSTSNGAIRTEDWNESYDYFRLIRYVRYGVKYDPFYMRVGTLDAARIGHGFLMNYYSNEASYDSRKIGLAFDLDFGSFGFETVTNNLGRAEIFGARAYWRPLRAVLNFPVIKNIAFGASYVTDIDPDQKRDSDDPVSAWGLDAELPLIQTKILTTKLYYDFGQIVDYGNGQAFGVMADLGNLWGLLDVRAKLERRLLGEEYTPNFFNALYEIHRNNPDIAKIYGLYEQNPGREADLRMLDHKAGILKFAPYNSETKGIFGELIGSFLGDAIRLTGMFQRLDDVPKSGMLHFGASAPDAVPTIAAHATYDKVGVETISDVFTLDSRSVARVGAGYKIKPYLILYMDYVWTFEEAFKSGQRYFKTQERVEPRLAFAYKF